MPHQPLTAVLAAVLAAGTTTGFHPGPAYYAYSAAIIGAVVGVPVYVVRRVRDHCRRR